MGKSDPVYYAGTIEAFHTAFLTFISEKFETGNIYDGFKSLYDLETIIYDYNLEVYKKELKEIINDMTGDYENNEIIMKNINTFLGKYFGIEENNVLFFDLFSKETDNKSLLLGCFPFMYKGKCNSDSNDKCYLYKPYSEKGYFEKEITPETKEIDIKSKINYIPSLHDELKKLDKSSFEGQSMILLHNKLNTILQDNSNKIQTLYGDENITPNYNEINLKEDLNTLDLYDFFKNKVKSMKSDYEYIKNYQTIKFIVKSEEIFKRAIYDLMYLEKMIAEKKDAKVEKLVEDLKGGKRRKSRRKNRSKKSKKSRKGRKTRRKSIRRHGRRH